MSSSHVAARNTSVFTILCFSLGLFASSAAVSQEVEIEVVGGNSSNSLMFGLNYGVDNAGNPVNQAITLNTDANQYPSLNSFTFVRNTCGEQRTDVVAASTNASRLVIYPGGLGTGASICGAGGVQAPCPPRPVGLSTSAEGKISVATSGASGTTPGVFTFAAGDVEETCGNFTRRGGRLTVSNTTIRAIADTEFVRADVGNLKAGDLLVLASNPAMIIRVPAGDIGPDGGIGEDAASGSVFPGSASAFSSFRRATPTGLAIVPGETPNILVTLSTGAIANFYWTGSVWSWKTFETGGLFPNPRGIGAGAREGVPYIVVSEQNRGRYIRQELDWEDDGSLKRSGEPGAFREIQSPVGAPEGVAVSQEDPNVFIAGECFNPVSGEPIGCNVGPASFHFSQGFEDGLKGARIRFEVQLIPDPSDNSERDGNPLGLLKLPNYKQDFFVPPTCRGFAVDGYDDEQLVLIDLELLGGLKVTAGNFAQVTGRLNEDLKVEESCAARVFYHPTKDSALNPLPECKDSEGAPETCTEGSERFAYTLFDTTVSCQSPSRGIITARSPVVLCENPNYDARVANPTGEVGRNEFVNPTIRIFLDDLKLAVAELGTEFPELKSKLNSLLTGFSNPDMGKDKVPDYYLVTSGYADIGAVDVFNLKRSGAFAASGLPSDLYARLLTGFLGLAFFTMEHGALIPYGPPAEFCEPYIEYPGPDGTTILYPELQDVKCAPLTTP